MTDGSGLPPVPPPGKYHEQQVRDAQQDVVEQGKKAIIELASALIPQVGAARAVLNLTDLEFTSAGLKEFLATKKGKKLPLELDKGIRDQIISYQREVRKLVDWMAVTVEYYGYYDSEQVAQALRAASERDAAITLISAEKAMNVSARSLKLLSEAFVDYNREILQRLPSAHGDDEREILFANAILVYETLDFMVRYLEDYQLNGLPQLEKLAADVRQRTSSALADVKRQRGDTEALQVTESEKERYYREQDAHEAAIKIIENEWKNFMSEKEGLANSIKSHTANQLAILRVRRDSARTRIEVLGLAAITRLIRESITDMEQASLEGASMEIAPLTPGRMRRLLGLEGEAIGSAVDD